MSPGLGADALALESFSLAFVTFLPPFLAATLPLFFLSTFLAGAFFLSLSFLMLVFLDYFLSVFFSYFFSVFLASFLSSFLVSSDPFFAFNSLLSITLVRDYYKAAGTLSGFFIESSFFFS